MFATVCGFEWEVGPAINVAQFFEYLTKHVQGTERTYGKTLRLMFFSTAGNFRTGLLVTIRDRRKFLELKETGRNYLFAVRESEPGSRPMEFNYFIVHPIVKRGLYLQYRGACGLRGFGTIMRKLYNETMTHHKLIEFAELDKSQKNRRKSDAQK